MDDRTSFDKDFDNCYKESVTEQGNKKSFDQAKFIELMQEEVYGGRERGVFSDDLSSSRPDSFNNKVYLRLNYIDQLLDDISN